MSAVVDVARNEGLALVVDEIYRELAYERGAVPSVAELAPEAFVTTGLSKARALGAC